MRSAQCAPGCWLPGEEGAAGEGRGKLMEGGARGGRAINKEHGHLYVRWAKKKQVPDRVCAGLEGGQGLGACRYLAEPQMLETAEFESWGVAFRPLSAPCIQANVPVAI